MRIPKRWHPAGWLVALTVLLAAVGVSPYFPPAVPLRTGAVSPQDVVAPRTVEFVDWERTEAVREEVAAAVPVAYRAVPEAMERSEQEARGLVESVLAVRADRTLSPEARRERLRRLGLQAEALEAALSLDRTHLVAALDAAVSAAYRLMARPLRPEDLSGARQQLEPILREKGVRGPALAFSRWVADRALRPNLVVDELQTRRAREAARAGVEPVRVRVLKDEVVVRRGEVVTPEQMRKLQALGLATGPWPWSKLAGTLVLVAALVAVLGVYLAYFQPEVWSSPKLLVLTGLLVWLGAAGTRLVAATIHPLLVPTAAVAILLAVLVNPRLALFAAGALAVLAGTLGTQDLRLVAVAYAGAAVGVFSARRIHRRTDLAYAGLLVGLANAATALALDLLTGAPTRDAALNAGVGAAGGVLCGILATGALPYLEDLFGLVTPIKLLELSNPSHPLLRRLQLEAPGTYHHTLMVANLAEAAAEAVGADPLLARVGTYYHDVGKLRRPGFFVENQVGGQNPHDRMAPSLSALAVAAHVRDGLELARQYRLPKVVADFIPQHHGTSLMAYFYHRAVEQQQGPVDPEAFRYEGPKPQTREAAIVMLADGVEAAARSVQNPTPERIRELVRRIVHERLEDGQLDECDLTFRDLERITQVFTRLLVSMFHPRLEYPEASLEAHRRRRQRGVGAIPVPGRRPRVGP
ncbi:MAG: HDIG domain-containing protein [Armatimonadota bacterium]|nr:HDIG domain-containing protein [Armatimonadota bacterium]MDR7462676.1 HDIG domain-containing protein [Armatimonadota bacterium]MDR7597160.1 HDIG domain-containing protein [Armatimonadota bacterium]